MGQATTKYGSYILLKENLIPMVWMRLMVALEQINCMAPMLKMLFMVISETQTQLQLEQKILKAVMTTSEVIMVKTNFMVALEMM